MTRFAHHFRWIVPALTAAVLAASQAAVGTFPVSAAEPPPTAATTASNSPVQYVVAISVDGLNPDALRQLGRSGAPSFYRLIDEGASTLNARTERESTETLPNHAGMVTGRWVTGNGGHGVTFNTDNGTTVHDNAGQYVSSMFDVVHNRGGSTGFYSSKDKLNLLDRSWNATFGAPDPVGADNGRDKIDKYYLGAPKSNVGRLVRRLRNAPDELSFLHIALPDLASRASGYMSAGYLDAVRRTDALVGSILKTVSDRPGLRRRVAVVLTSDHGGTGAGHRVASNPENYTVPFLVWGAGVARGRGLYALNPDTRRPPGDLRTTYRGVQPVRNGDLANLVTDLFDLPPVPGSTFNRRQNLRVS